MPNENDSISQTPTWILSPTSSIPLRERAAARKALAEAISQRESSPALHNAYWNAVLEVNVIPGNPSRDIAAKCLRDLRRSGDREGAKALLRLISGKGPGRPTSHLEYYGLAERFALERSKLREDRKGGRVSIKEVEKKIFDDSGISVSKMRRARRKFGDLAEARVEARCSLAKIFGK